MPKKILIVDDSLFMRTILKDLLSDKYKIVEAESGSRAEKQIKKEKPDLVLLDIIMPEGEEEGIRVLKKSMKTFPNLKIVMITAVGQDTIVEECKKLGAINYIVKPFDDEQVIRIVRKYLG
jgi:two-component system chemotaxis response regulator CheY